MDIRSFLADTNIVSETTKIEPNAAIKKWIRRGPNLLISYPVIFELEWGIANLERYNASRARRLSAWVEQLIAEAGDNFLAMTPAIARLHSRMMELPELRGMGMSHAKIRNRPPPQDLCIAAVAITYQLPIATRDTLDFGRIHEYFPLPGVYNPAINHWSIPRSTGPRLRRSTRDASPPMATSSVAKKETKVRA